MNFDSIWNNNPKQKYDSLKKNIECDVLIIGGGIAGASTAYFLRESNMKVCLIEQGLIGNSVTKNSSAKLTYLQEDLILKISKYKNKDYAKIYLLFQREGINEVVDIIDRHHIDCNLSINKSYLYCKDEKNVQKLKQIEKFINDEGIIIHHDRIPKSLNEKYSFNINDSYVLDIYKFTCGLIEISKDNGIEIYEKTKLYNFEFKNNLYSCRVNNNIITTKYIVLACHYPYFFLPYMMPFRVTLEKSYIKVKEVKDNLHFNAINIDNEVDSIRYFNRDDKTYELRILDSHSIVTKYNKDNNMQYDLSNVDIITQDYIPLIGFIKKNLILITGFNTWGIASSVIGGKLIYDLLTYNINKYEPIFDPKRFFEKATLYKLPVCIGSNVFAYIKTFLFQDRTYFKREKGYMIGVYVDTNGVEHKVRAICPHACCHLVFNAIDKTWDCPCHGSRFDIDGMVVFGPTNYNIKY